MNDFRNFNQSDSKPGWYRTNSRRRWMRSGSQTSRPEPGSFSRDRRGKSAETFDRGNRGRSLEKKDFVSNKDLLEELKKIKVDIAECKQNFVELKQKAVSVVLVEEEEIEVKNVFFYRTKFEIQYNDTRFRSTF